MKANRGKIGSSGSDSYACGNIKSHDFTVPADIRGGAAYVRVCLDDKALKDLKCKLIARPA